ncbi:MAG: hypothetical protein FWG90_02885 [Oscillospiraceae bacterium]|nr:hypothetical protein [Oscillospiraceae bacterium]
MMRSDKEYAIKIYRHVFNSENNDDCDVVGMFNAINNLDKMERIVINCQFRYGQSNDQIALTLGKNAEQIEKYQTEIFHKLQQSSPQKSMSISLKSNELTTQTSIDELGLSPQTTQGLKKKGFCTGKDILETVPPEDKAKVVLSLIPGYGELFKKLELLGHNVWVEQMRSYGEQMMSEITPILSNLKSPFNFSREDNNISTIEFLCKHFGFANSDITDSELFVRNYLYATITRQKEFYSHTYSWKIGDFIRIPPVLDVEPIDFLCDKLKVARANIQDDGLFVRNYIFITAKARKHLMEIKNRISVLQLDSEKVIDSEKDYAKERREYFLGINKKAQKELETWVASSFGDFLLSCFFLKDLVNEGLNILLDRGIHSYFFESEHKYYDCEYDFSTLVKFDSVVPDYTNDDPDDPLRYMRQKSNLTEKFLHLKKTDMETYKSELISYAQNSQIMALWDMPKIEYFCKERTEIFSVLAHLLNERLYSTFCVLAVLQIEGLFNDYLAIKKLQAEGNLGEKVDASIKDDVRFRDVYSYFRYDIKILRNEVAHSGLLNTCDAELTAYELMLDLFCICNILSGMFIAKFEPFFIIADKIYNDECTDKEEAVLVGLWEKRVIWGKEFWGVLANPSLYDDEMRHFRPDDIPDDALHLCEFAHDISRCVKTEKFWGLVLDECKDNTNVDKAFVQTLIDELESTLDAEAKKICNTVKEILNN